MRALPWAHPTQLLVDRFHAERLQIELPTNPLLHLIMFLVIRVSQGFQHLVIAPDSSAVLGRTRALPGNAHGALE